MINNDIFSNEIYSLMYDELLLLSSITNLKLFSKYRSDFIKRYNLTIYQFGKIYVQFSNIKEYVDIILQWEEDTQGKEIKPNIEVIIQLGETIVNSGNKIEIYEDCAIIKGLDKSEALKLMWGKYYEPDTRTTT